MLAYRKAELENSIAGLPSPFYSPNLYIRIGLFIFGAICAQAALGMFFLITNGWVSGDGYGFLLLIFGAGLIFAVEKLIRREKPFFRAGLEEALLYAALGCILAGVLMQFRMFGRIHFPMALFMGCVFAAASLRYADSLLAALSQASAFYALFDMCHGLGNRAGYVLPPLMIFFSALTAKAAGWALRKEAWRTWEHLWKVLRFLALLTAYAGGNYFINRELSQLLFGMNLRAEQDIPFAAIFYFWTYGLPPAYIAAGMIRKDRLCLNAGLVVAAMAVFTFKYYHRVMSVEMGLTLAGLFLIAMAWAALRLFKDVRYGITAQAVPGAAGSGKVNAESLALLQTFGAKDAPAQAPEGFQGGGGSFGGGGASGKF